MPATRPAGRKPRTFLKAVDDEVAARRLVKAVETLAKETKSIGIKVRRQWRREREGEAARMIVMGLWVMPYDLPASRWRYIALMRRVTPRKPRRLAALV